MATWQVKMRTATGGVARRTRTKRAACEIAQIHCSTTGATAEIVDPRGRASMRYWRDSEGLQYLEY